MITTVLNFNDGKVYLIHHAENADMEELLFSKHNFSQSNIQWMSTKNEKIVCID